MKEENDNNIYFKNKKRRTAIIFLALLLPAVFWNLDKLEMGDYIYVIDGNNNKKGFQIISIAKYETGAAPMEKIFGASDGAFLNLITCGGVWDKTMNNYTERLVVYTKLAL